MSRELEYWLQTPLKVIYNQHQDRVDKKQQQQNQLFWNKWEKKLVNPWRNRNLRQMALDCPQQLLDITTTKTNQSQDGDIKFTEDEKKTMKKIRNFINNFNVNEVASTPKTSNGTRSEKDQDDFQFVLSSLSDWKETEKKNISVIFEENEKGNCHQTQEMDIEIIDCVAHETRPHIFKIPSMTNPPLPRNEQ